MSRLIWFLAGLLLSLRSFVDMLEGPPQSMAWVDPTVWTIVFAAGGFAWILLALDAARGRFE